MQPVIQTLQNQLKRGRSLVLVSVVGTYGSVPREVGATLLVSADETTGTIGGGNLEFTAIDRARQLLASGATITCERVSLGPKLGQCCGGGVELFYQVVQAASLRWAEIIVPTGSKEWWLGRCLDSEQIIFLPSDDPKIQLLDLPSHGAIIITDATQHRWLYQCVNRRLPPVWLFGAGHVGQAVTAQLSLLPCKLTVIDQREEWLSQCALPGVDLIHTDAPELEVADAPADTCFLVMTHSHSVDFDICLATLRLEQCRWLGLIGSNTKRQTFYNRLKQRGISDALIGKMRCPIGQLPLQSSRPASIALSVAAELAFEWESSVVTTVKDA